MKLIVGLGNPGKEYEKTRHNIGFLIMDSYLPDADWVDKFNSKIYKTKIDDETVLFIKPQTFVNNSGDSIKKIVDYYKINNEDILIICDDLTMELGKIKLKNDSSSGGHNGLRSIINKLNSKQIPRLKVGISDKSNFSAESFVLGKFKKRELELIFQNDFGKIIDSVIKNGFFYTLENYKNENF